MAFLRTVISVTGLILVISCAAAKDKPALPDELYQPFAWRWVGVHQCGQLGLIDPGTAALGMRYARADADTYEHDISRMSVLIREISSRPFTQVQCNTLAMGIQAEKQRIDQHNAGVAASQKEWSGLINTNKIPAPVFCNRAGTMVSCN